MPTLTELQNLPPEGYLAILKMSESELEIYLKDITILEPEGVASILDASPDEDNGESGGLVKKSKTKTKKAKVKMSDEDMMNDLLSDSDKDKLKEGF